MDLKPIIRKQQPSLDILVEIAEMLARIQPDDIIRVDSSDCADNREFSGILNKAVRLSHDALSIQFPGNIKNERTIEEWMSCHPEYLDRIIVNPGSETRITVEKIHEMPFINGPFRDSNRMGYIPQGHVIIGMTDNCEEVVRGEVDQDRVVRWFWKIDEQRLAAVIQLFESINIDNILVPKGCWISGKGDWDGRRESNIWLRHIDVDSGKKGHPGYVMMVSVSFEPGRDKVAMAKLDCPGLDIVGFDVMQREDDSLQP